MLQFQVSPPKRISKNIEPNENRASPPTYLILGPHAKVPKIHFQELKLGKSKKEVLIIRNPSDTCVNLKFVKKPSADFVFSCDIDAIISVPETAQLDVEITWTPSKEGHFFEVCQLVNSLNGIKLSVQLLGVCSAPPPSFKSRSGFGSIKRRPLVFPTQSNIPIEPPAKAPLTFGKSAPIPIKQTNTSAANLMKTPPKLSTLELLENMSFPFTPESAIRRETFIVEKRDSYTRAIEDENDFNQTYRPDDASTTKVTPIFNYETVSTLEDELHDPRFDDFDKVDVEKRDNLFTESLKVRDDLDEEDCKIQDNLDEAKGELDNLENLVRGFLTSVSSVTY